MNKFTKCLISSIIPLCVMPLMLPSMIEAENVLIKTKNKSAQGIIKIIPRTQKFVVLTVLHEFENVAPPILILGSMGAESKGEIDIPYRDHDLAILQVYDGGEVECHQYDEPNNLDNILSRTNIGHLVFRKTNWESDNISARIVEFDKKSIEIKIDPRFIHTGLSGSPLIINNKYLVGIVKTVNKGDNYCHVHRIDDINKIIKEYIKAKSDSLIPRFRYGVKGLIGISKLKGDAITKIEKRSNNVGIDFDNKANLAIGASIFAEYAILNRYIWIGSELNVINKKGEIEQIGPLNDIYNEKLNLLSLELNPIIKFKVWSERFEPTIPFIFGGISLGLNIIRNGEVTINEQNYSGNLNEIIRLFEVGFVAGVGVELLTLKTMRIAGEYRYSSSLRSIRDDDEIFTVVHFFSIGISF